MEREGDARLSCHSWAWMIAYVCGGMGLRLDQWLRVSLYCLVLQHLRASAWSLSRAFRYEQKESSPSFKELQAIGTRYLLSPRVNNSFTEHKTQHGQEHHVLSNPLSTKMPTFHTSNAKMTMNSLQSIPRTTFFLSLKLPHLKLAFRNLAALQSFFVRGLAPRPRVSALLPSYVVPFPKTEKLERLMLLERCMNCNTLLYALGF